LGDTIGGRDLTIGWEKNRERVVRKGAIGTRGGEGRDAGAGRRSLPLISGRRKWRDSWVSEEAI